MSKTIHVIRKRITIPVGSVEHFFPLAHPALASWRQAGVRHSGYSRLKRGYHIGIPDQSDLMLIATTGGRGAARTMSGKIMRFSPGTLLVNPAGDPIEFWALGTGWVVIWWYLKPSPQWMALAEAGTRVETLSEADLLYRLGQLIIERTNDPAFGPAEAFVRHAAEGILMHLHGAAPAAERHPAEDAIHRTWRVATDRLNEPWSLEDLADHAGMSTPTFQRRTRQYYGLSAHQLLLDRRMRHARGLLRQTDYPLRVIADLVGYADPFTFSTAFRRHTGCPPSAFRSRNDDGHRPNV